MSTAISEEMIPVLHVGRVEQGIEDSIAETEARIDFMMWMERSYSPRFTGVGAFILDD